MHMINYIVCANYCDLAATASDDVAVIRSRYSIIPTMNRIEKTEKKNYNLKKEKRNARPADRAAHMKS